MNRTSGLLLLSIAMSSLASGCSDEAKHKAMEKKYNAIQADKAQHKTMSAEEMAEHSGGGMQHEMPMAKCNTPCL